MSPPRTGRTDTSRWIATFAVALAVLLALLLVRPDRWVGSPGPSPSLTPSSPAVTEPTPAAAVAGAWRSLAITKLTVGPAGAEAVAAWAGGYLAVGSTPADGVAGWTSMDGQAWEPLPPGTFGGTASRVAAVAAIGGVVVGVERPNLAVEVYRLRDGAWTQLQAPRLGLGESQLASGPDRLLAVARGDPNGLQLTTDGTSWQVTGPSGLNRMDIGAVAVVGDLYLALGSQVLQIAEGGGRSAARAAPPVFPAAWWSRDGLAWESAVIAEGPSGHFGEVHAGAIGLVALSRNRGAPSSATYWQSTDGRSWTVSDANPLGVWPEGEGQGGANGLFRGDGDRLLDVGQRARGRPFEAWVAFDGLAWDRLAVAGDDAESALAASTPFLLPNGLLLVERQGPRVWFGAASAE
jgi:hypothetical protein